MPRVKPFLLALPVFLVLTGCADVGRQPDSGMAPSAATRIEPPAHGALQTPQERAQFHVMVGTMAAGRNQPELAARQFMQALNDAPDADLAARATTLALAASDEPLALRAVRKWLELAPNDLHAHALALQLAIRSGNLDLAVDQCRRIIALESGPPARGYSAIAQILSQEPSRGTAITKVMDRLLAADPQSTAAHQAAALLALRLQQPDRAERQARLALKLEPDSRDAALLLTAALVRENRLAESDQVMRHLYAGSDADDLRLGYAQMLVQMNHADHARAPLRQILAKHPHDQDAHFLMGLIDLGEQRLDTARKHFAVAAAGDGERASDAQFYLGRIAQIRRQPQRALDHYRRVIQGREVFGAGLRQAEILAHRGQMPQAETLLQGLSERYPQRSPQIIVTESQILLDAGRRHRAAELLGQALTQLPDNRDLLYMQALVDEQLGDVGKAENTLEKLLKRSPNDPRLLNALGYMLAEHNPTELTRAQQLVTQALHITPDDPAVIDSMGWVLYRQGHLHQSLKYLQSAYARLADPEVAAHLVTVLAKLGRNDQAHQVLEKALATNPHNTALQKISERLAPAR